MAKVIIQRAWEHGADALTIEVRVDDSFPDVVAEAVANAVKGYRESLEITVNETVDEEGDG